MTGDGTSFTSELRIGCASGLAYLSKRGVKDDLIDFDTPAVTSLSLTHNNDSMHSHLDDFKLISIGVEWDVEEQQYHGDMAAHLDRSQIVRVRDWLNFVLSVMPDG